MMGGSFPALGWARDLDLPAPEKALMYALVSYVDEKNECFPSQARLAKDAGLGERTVRRYLRVWERSGLIERTARMRGEGKGRSSDRIRVAVGSTIDQPARAAAWDVENQPAADDDQPAAESTTNRPIVGQGTTRELPDRSSAARRSDGETICATCGCSTDRPGSRRVKRKDVVCLHEMAS